MAKPKAPRSAVPALTFTGPAIDGYPDRDLTTADLARLAFVACDPESRPFTTADITPAQIADTVAVLVNTGSYTTPATPASED
jgi:hypothetical protein